MHLQTLSNCYLYNFPSLPFFFGKHRTPLKRIGYWPYSPCIQAQGKVGNKKRQRLTRRTGSKAPGPQNIWVSWFPLARWVRVGSYCFL